MTSIHSNEPFTSFTFYGKGHNQILVASLNYSLKLYKLRTSSFLHSIILEDLKSNKTPITSITSHPIQDNFILISSDNRLILFDLKTSTSLKTYCSREILPGVINFIYLLIYLFIYLLLLFIIIIIIIILGLNNIVYI